MDVVLASGLDKVEEQVAETIGLWDWLLELIRLWDWLLELKRLWNWLLEFLLVFLLVTIKVFSAFSNFLSQFNRSYSGLAIFEKFAI
jgi:hypothetical protein